MTNEIANDKMNKRERGVMFIKCSVKNRHSKKKNDLNSHRAG